ncbi:MAG: hypothetical protein M9913_01635 [Bryobacteraceae bacterium]|nr:hypothetical protein [Solibacteraceae bacterium]MCL4840299.1 hypothetical protein [Bryobacteraceae bacterium]MCO5349608.1 hypothetical protein [Bryobacteraceae bacterium]HAX45013.1 hypothetical protein [Bryobacterales bacterium]HRJ17572.1 hypothetical protein [Bryobacteraceae bacterium]
MKTCIALFLTCSFAAAQDPVAWLPPAESLDPAPVSLADLEKLERRYRDQLETQQKALDDVTREIQRLKSEKTSLEDYKKIQESKETRQVEFNWTKISERIDKAAAYYDLSWQFTESSGSVLEISDGMFKALNALASQETPIAADRLNKAMDFLENEARRRKRMEIAGVVSQGAVNVLKLDLGVNLLQQFQGKTEDYRGSYRTLLCLKEFHMRQGANRNLFRAQLKALEEQRTRNLTAVDALNAKLRELVTPQGVSKNITAAEFRARAKDYFLSLKPPKTDVVVANAPWSYAETRLEATWSLLRESQRVIRQYLAFVDALENFASNNAGYLMELREPCSIDPTLRYEVGGSIDEFKNSSQAFGAAKARIQKSAPVQVLLDL